MTKQPDESGSRISEQKNLSKQESSLIIGISDIARNTQQTLFAFPFASLVSLLLIPFLMIMMMVMVMMLVMMVVMMMAQYAAFIYLSCGRPLKTWGLVLIVLGRMHRPRVRVFPIREEKCAPSVGTVSESTSTSLNSNHKIYILNRN